MCPSSRKLLICSAFNLYSESISGSCNFAFSITTNASFKVMEFILNHLTLKYCFLFITSNNCYMKKDSLLQHIKSCIVLSVSFVIFKIKHEQTATAVNPANTIVIHQEVDFKITPSKLFHALIDSKQFSD